MTPEKAFGVIVQLEGGDKLIVDAGGLTKYGVSQKAYPNLDIKNLTFKDATAIFVKDYWLAAKCDRLPEPLDLLVADAAYNMGAKAAVMLLQQAIGDVPVDGLAGPRTISGAHGMDVRELCARYMAQRHLRYIGLRRFSSDGKGWFNRLGRLMMFMSRWSDYHWER